MNRLALSALLVLGACTATVRTAPVQPAPPPPAQPAPPPMAAQPRNHPAYLHALTDLRAARAQLQRPANVAVKWDERLAIQELDVAIREIKEAAIDDGKNLNDHEPVDRPTWGGRLQRALELIEKARADVSEEEDSPSSQVHRLRISSLQHIANADRMVRDGIEDARALREPPPAAAPPPPMPPAAPPAPPAGDQPGAHPAYLHALSDLRTARAMLERPTHGADVKWDEKQAVNQIDAAIREIRQASIDDGKPLNDHPPIDANLHHRDRIRNAAELLEKAAHDIEEREDNGFARGMRGRAVGHIREAIRFTREAIEDRHR